MARSTGIGPMGYAEEAPKTNGLGVTHISSRRNAARETICQDISTVVAVLADGRVRQFMLARKRRLVGNKSYFIKARPAQTRDPGKASFIFSPTDLAKDLATDYSTRWCPSRE